VCKINDSICAKVRQNGIVRYCPVKNKWKDSGRKIRIEVWPHPMLLELNKHVDFSIFRDPESFCYRINYEDLENIWSWIDRNCAGCNYDRISLSEYETILRELLKMN